MKKFRYSMQNILDVQYRLEEVAKGEYSVAQGLLNEELRKLDLLYAQLREYEKELTLLMTGKLDFREITFMENAVEHKKNSINEQKKSVIAAEKTVEKARKKLNDVMVERKTHELLKEKSLEQYMKELNKEEATEVDELVSFRYNGSKDE